MLDLPENESDVDGYVDYYQAVIEPIEREWEEG